MFQSLRNWKLKNKNKLAIEQRYIEKYRNTINPQVFNVLMEQYVSGNTICKPIYDELTEADLEKVYSDIDNSDFLSPQEKFETIMYLMDILSGGIPESNVILSRLEKIAGKEFSDAVKNLRERFKEDILWEKAIKYIKDKRKDNLEEK